LYPGDISSILPVSRYVLFCFLGAVPTADGGARELSGAGQCPNGDEKLLGVVAQLDPRVEDPAAADLHKVGTLSQSS